MATNKHAIIRYQTLNKCFRNPGRNYDINDLVDACNKAIYDNKGNDEGVKKRSVYSDITFMESEQGWSIPLERIKDGRKIYFRYSDITFSINNQPLNESEENQLREALLTLSRFKGMPQFQWVDELSVRLDSGLGLSKNGGSIVEFEQNEFLKGLENITPIYNAIVYQSALNISYKSFKQELLQNFILHPYYLKQYKTRWFVFGRNDATGDVLNLALDRIIEIADSKRKYIKNKTINFNEYFDDFVGVTHIKENKLEKIILRIANDTLPYIKTKPMHGSQKYGEAGKTHSIVTLDLIQNYELESTILSYGDSIEVLAPKSLRNTLTKKVELMEKNYATKRIINK